MSFDLDALTDRFAPNEEFHIVRVPGYVFAFRAIADHSMLSATRRRAAEWAKNRQLPPEYVAFRPNDSETATNAFMLAELQVEVPASEITEEFKPVPVIGIGGWCKIAKKSGLLMDSVWRAFDAMTIYGVDESEAVGIDEAKKESSPAPDLETV